MKAKFIKMQIARKVNQWLESIDDTSVREQVKDNVIVTGGCIVSMLLNEKVNDYDVYLRTRQAARALADYYVRKFKENPPQRFKNSAESVDIRVVEDALTERIKIVVKSSGIAGESGSDDYQYFEQQTGSEDQTDFVEAVVQDAQETVEADAEKAKPKFRPMFLSANAITLSHGVQVIIRFVGEPSDVHSTYDFIHCTCHWKSWDRELVLPPAALESILTRELRYMGQSKYPVCAMIRVRKFLKRGWHVTAGQLLKIAFDINKLDLTDFAVLEDQLTGVDSAYFAQVIEMLRARDPNKIDGSYLMEVIDKIF